ncbi:hypothetical protein REMIM1_CH02820 [Rhizobium etli bv. mimosae str. Mim1]|nr:hypothetical protein REMIM1_CH02820 [Rhizobium etli bv. mimosae str. Mim1]
MTAMTAKTSTFAEQIVSRLYRALTRPLSSLILSCPEGLDDVLAAALAPAISASGK